MSRIRRIALRFLLLTLSLGCSAALIEGLMHLCGLDYALLWEPDPELGWVLIPGAQKHNTKEGDAFVTVNSLGQRDKERSLRKAPGAFRVGIFGDSLTEAIQVAEEKTFCALLERRLNQLGRPVEVLNFGVSGYSPVQAFLSVRRNVGKYQLDLVVLATFLDNDVAGCHPELNPTGGAAPYAVFEGEHLRMDFSAPRRSYESYRSEPTYSLRRLSCLYRMLGEFRRVWVARRQVRDDVRNNLVPRRFRLYELPLQPPWEEAWATFERVLIAAQREATQQGARFVVLSIPAAQIVNRASWENLLQEYPAMNELSWELGGPERRLQAMTQRLGVAFVSLADSFTAWHDTHEDDPLYFGNVGHMTEQGHTLAADILGDYLVRTGMTEAARNSGF